MCMPSVLWRYCQSGREPKKIRCHAEANTKPTVQLMSSREFEKYDCEFATRNLWVGSLYASAIVATFILPRAASYGRQGFAVVQTWRRTVCIGMAACETWNEM